MVRPPRTPTDRDRGRLGWRYPGHTPRRNAGLGAYETALTRAGLAPIVGIDEAGRGACGGPLVVAAVALDCAAIRRLPGLADSKALSPDVRERVYEHVLRHAVDWHVLAIPAREIDTVGLHVCNVAGMRRALAGLRCRPGYVLTDGFPVRGLAAPALAVWKGDQVAASVAAASVVAKVSRDRMMVELGERYPGYGFAQHKGYVTAEHMRALLAHGPCPEHRTSYLNVIAAIRQRAAGAAGLPDIVVDPAEMAEEVASAEVTTQDATDAGSLGEDVGEWGTGRPPDQAAQAARAARAEPPRSGSAPVELANVTGFG